MKIYTRTGDKGRTSLYGGERVKKSSLRVEAIGTVDELNGQIGLICSLLREENTEVSSDLIKIQNDLFMLGSSLARMDGKLIGKFNLDDRVLEARIDQMTGSLPVLRNFILPGGTEISAQIHIARSTARRAERRIVDLSENEKINPLVLRYINRLSDYFFTLARYVNHKKRILDVKWVKK